MVFTDSRTIIHGLEQLIEHYQEKENGLVSAKFVPHEDPPHYSRRNGRTNLLHRATKEGILCFKQHCLLCNLFGTLYFEYFKQ